MTSFSLVVSLLFVAASALDNGFRLPPMGWSSWYGCTSNINESLITGMADAMADKLLFAGYKHIWIDDGFALPRDNITNRIVVDPALFPSGFANLSDYIHGKGLLFGIYTSKGPLTCLGYQPTQPKRPGSCGYEQLDADTYANEWHVDQVKDDGCGDCPIHDPFIAMRDALNGTGRHMLYQTHSAPNGTVANAWRTGGDLYSSSFDMWTNRLDLATTPEQAALAGPGSLPDPDFLEVGWSPRAPKGPNSMTPLEQRSMFTMWAALPTGLILSADLRTGIDDPDILATLTNAEVIAINQDDLVAPMRPLFNVSGIQVWRKPLAAGPSSFAIVFFHRGVVTTGPIPNPPAVVLITIDWATLGLTPSARVAVRDLWDGVDLGVFQGSFAQNVTQRDARIYTFTVQAA